jgi:uncharacterized membrane-anchored protein
MSDFCGFIKWVVGNLYDKIGWIIYFVIVLSFVIFLPTKLAGIFMLVCLVIGLIYCTYRYYIEMKEIKKLN